MGNPNLRAANARHANIDQPAAALSTGAAGPIQLRAAALARWASGDSASLIEQALLALDSGDFDSKVWPSAESAQLRMRVIALESLVIALLARVPEEHTALARDIAAYISPRPGYTPHQLTLRAADQMRRLVDRSAQFRVMPLT